MQIAQPHPDCTISHEGRYVRAIVGPGSARQIQECWRTIAALALENKFSRALVVGTAAGEPLAQLAARDPLEQRVGGHLLGGLDALARDETGDSLQPLGDVDAEEKFLRLRPCDLSDALRCVCLRVLVCIHHVVGLFKARRFSTRPLHVL